MFFESVSAGFDLPKRNLQRPSLGLCRVSEETSAPDASGRRRQASKAAAGAPAPPRADAGLIKVDPSRVSSERHREAGPVHVGYQFWRRLELDRILRECGLSQTVQRLACVMTLNRLIAPCSEHAMPDWIRRTALADILDVDFEGLAEDPLYQVLDKLHPHRAAIEAALVARERSLFNLDATIYLYDLTSTYFEGLAAKNGKAKRGYSRSAHLRVRRASLAMTGPETKTISATSPSPM